MGIVYEGLEDHEGFAAHLLHDGTITGTYSAATREFTSYVAACSCGWKGSSHPATQEGRMEAEEAWDAQHASPLLRVAIPSKVRQAIAAARQEIAELARCRPEAATTALAEVGRWALSLTKELDRQAPRRDRSGLGL
jgi:hypothetical protein